MRAFAIAPLLDKVPEADMATLAQPGCTGAEGYKKEEQGTKRPTMPGARWAPWTSSSTRTSRSFLSRPTKQPSLVETRVLQTSARVKSESGPDSHPLFRCLPHCSARVV